MGKIGDLLADEESMKQLSELAQMMMSDGDNNSASDNSCEGESNSDSDSGSDLFPKGFDLSSLMKLQDIMGAMTQKDKNADLLLALKPHLRDEKREKVDKAIKILKLLAVWNIVKESGMLKDFI